MKPDRKHVAAALFGALTAGMGPAPRADWNAIEAGSPHTCALRSSGAARCWGQNDYGQLGNDATASSSIPVDVSGLNNAVAISAGDSHSCAVVGDGTARCWGNNVYGQLGNGQFSNPNFVDPLFEKTPVQVTGLDGAVEISCGAYSTCALLKDGTARCWGSNSSGQLGYHAPLTHWPTPLDVSGLKHAIAISVGGRHACALLNDGRVLCWGANPYGQLGNGTTTNSPVPVAVAGLKGVLAISAGASHTCAALRTGAVRCWGQNSYGQLGNGTTTNSPVPIAVTGLTGAVAVSVSAGEVHTCAVLSTSTVRCWGANNHGQLGSGIKITGSKVPVSVAFLGGTHRVTAGSVHSCALLNDGTGRCWGWNVEGQLGNGTTIGSAFPVTVLE